tara:strand:+ start:991 stop:1863 length:873 start_codon:yes stop_codon:yes gene_type:complete
MIYKVESIYVTIDKIVRDLGLGSSEIPVDDFIEWIRDGLEDIGAYSQLTEKSCNLAVIDYKAVLPCDCYKVNSFLGAVSVTLTQAQEDGVDTGGFYGGTYQQALANAGQDWSEMPAYEKYKDLLLGITKIDNYRGSQGGANSLYRNEDMFSLNDAWGPNDYNVNHDIVSTSFKEGVIYLKYLSFPVDEEGLPMVPDNVSYRRALFWKCAYHLSLRNPESMPNPRLRDMEYCENKWALKCTQARAEANMGDLEEHIKIKNRKFNMFQGPGEDRNGFRNLGRFSSTNFDGNS